MDGPWTARWARSAAGPISSSPSRDGALRWPTRGAATIDGPLARLDSRFAERLAESLIAQGLRALDARFSSVPQPPPERLRPTPEVPSDGRDLLPPGSLPEALRLLDAHGPALLVIAGGTVAMPLINDGISLPGKVMGLRRTGLDRIEASATSCASERRRP